MRLKDVAVDRPRLLLVGINPGLRSGEVGHHFAGNGNPFWRLLHAAGITPRLLGYQEDQQLASFGVGLTNLCPRTTRTAAELTAAEIASGRKALLRKASRWQPEVVALVGVTLYRMCFPAPPPSTAGGPGAKPERMGGAPVFVVPNPSGLNASFPGFEHKLVWFKKLREFMAAQADHAAAHRAGSRR